MEITKALTSIPPKFENSKCEICEDKVCNYHLHEIYNNAFTKGRLAGKQIGFLEGLKRHTWMKDGVIYVGNGTYTLQEAIEFGKKDGLISELT